MVARRLVLAAQAGKERLFAGHVADYQALFHRLRLDLGTTAPELAALPTDRRLAEYRDHRATDPDLEELFFQYGRYLLISSSRAAASPRTSRGCGTNPTSRRGAPTTTRHQRGDELLARRAGEPGECDVPFIDYVVNQREVRGMRTREHYGEKTRGWTVQTENGIYGGSSWKWNPPASAWYAQHLWEHFAFGQDRDYLARTAYPVLKEVSEFWVDPCSGARRNAGGARWLVARARPERGRGILRSGDRVGPVHQLPPGRGGPRRRPGLPPPARRDCGRSSCRSRWGSGASSRNGRRTATTRRTTTGTSRTSSRSIPAVRSRRGPLPGWPRRPGCRSAPAAMAAPAGAGRGRSTFGPGSSMAIMPTSWCGTSSRW